jgi:hypothetical protein
VVNTRFLSTLILEFERLIYIKKKGRVVVLEAKSTNSSNKIASHVLCNYGNEILYFNY